MSGKFKDLGNFPDRGIGLVRTNNKLMHRRVGKIVIDAEFVQRDLFFFQMSI